VSTLGRSRGGAVTPSVGTWRRRSTAHTPLGIEKAGGTLTPRRTPSSTSSGRVGAWVRRACDRTRRAPSRGCPLPARQAPRGGEAGDSGTKKPQPGPCRAPEGAFWRRDGPREGVPGPERAWTNPGGRGRRAPHAQAFAGSRHTPLRWQSRYHQESARPSPMSLCIPLGAVIHHILPSESNVEPSRFQKPSRCPRVTIITSSLPARHCLIALHWAEHRVPHIPPDFVVERARHSPKASGREDLQIEEPITGGYSPALDFHATVAAMLGPTLIRHQVVEVRQPCEKRLLTATGTVKPLHRPRPEACPT
jgi:hypothetical protein